MDDEIDIEEHDLLDNPAIKDIFPDLSILKKEISGYFEEASGIKKEPDINEQIITNKQDHDTGFDLNDSNTKKIEFPDYVTPEFDKTEKAQTPLLGNKIILGSKPTQPTKIKLKDTRYQDIYAAKVYLNDIGSYLASSKRFCEICLRMFPQNTNLEIHMATVHTQNSMCNMSEIKNRITLGSIKKTYKCNECSESFSQQSLLRRHLINVHRKKLSKSVIDSDPLSLQLSRPLSRIMVQSTKLNQCFHCKVSFSSKKLLIEHIYMVLQSKKRNPVPKPTNTDKLCKKGQMKSTVKLSKIMIKKRRQRDVDSNCRTKINKGNVKDTNVPIRHKKTVPLHKNVKILKTNTSIFQCVYCSYIFSNMQFCLKHIVNKHKDLNIKNVKAVIFDDQCKYCSKKNNNWKLHNIHMQMYHKQKIDKTIKVYPKICLPKVDHFIPQKQVSEQKAFRNTISDKLNENQTETDFDESLDIEEPNEVKEYNSVNTNQILLKSVLFKCKRCDIHFLSAKSAMNHADHMELLINWKCLSCNKILKKVDEKLHMKQHSFSNNFTVFELTETQLARILYKCSKCAIHFDANGYLPHFRKCEMAVAESVYCKICDILIDKEIGGSHESCHNEKNIKSTDFTILTSDAIGVELIKKTVIKSAVKNRLSKKKIHNPQFCFNLSYCKTCNSFISNKGRNRIVHMESRCAHLPTYVCQVCGLIFTNKTMGTHRIMHNEKKGIRLQDFSFYSFSNGKQITPPIPKYPKCKICHVHFISKVAVINHLCNEDFLTCHVCNIKLSEPVFKLHMSFHYYSKTNKHENDSSRADNMHLSKTLETCEDKRRPPRPPPRNRDMSATGPRTKSAEFGKPESNNVVNKKLSDKSQSYETEYGKVNNIIKEDTKLLSDAVLDECKFISTKNTDSVQIYKMNQKYRKSDFALFKVLYCCINCRTTIDTYDSVVEHCQDHLCGVEINKIGCETCKLKLDLKSYENHKEFHAVEVTNKSFELIKFDTFYFSLDNSIWITHVFQNVDKEISQLILDRSIYKYGGKMKMQVIQEGITDLTVYKCNSCFVIVDPDSLLKHVENSCFKTRKHPCSYCGLPFMSYMSLKKHMNIHKKMNNISLKSYRIVIINQEKDKKSNKVINGPNKYFLLYKCRNCNGVFDKYQRQSHTMSLCDEKNLKKCSICDLLFNSFDYKTHMHKHELICNFVPKNMQIILFGQGSTNKMDENPTKETNFDGTIVDFTFIQCVKCKVCLEKSTTATLNHHTCYEDSVMSKCTNCELFILKNKLSRHTKLHDKNVHFVKENMNIIPYDHSKQLTKFIPADLNQLNGQQSEKTKTCHLREEQNIEYSNIMKGSNKTINFTSPHTADKSLNIIEKTAKLLKCSCGLHFMDKTSINEHFDQCNSKISKQHCSKCNLLFTPNVLFTHLLLHHGDKKCIYKFNIIEMSKKKNKIITLYKCINCKTHFIKYNKAKVHFEYCKEFEADRNECTKCKFFFSSCSIAQHETLHHDENVADIEIVDVMTNNVYETDQNKTDARSIDNVIEQADFVRESKYNISDEKLSQIDLSRYSNTIFKCETCNTHFLSEHTFRSHFSNGKHVLSPQNTCNFCKLRFSLPSLAKHMYIHHKQMKLNNNDIIIKSNV